MEQYISKSALVAVLKRLRKNNEPKENMQYAQFELDIADGYDIALDDIEASIDTLEVKEVGLIMHTIIAECCDWLAMNTNLSHDKIEECRNLMLTVKKEQFKAQKGE